MKGLRYQMIYREVNVWLLAIIVAKVMLQVLCGTNNGTEI